MLGKNIKVHFAGNDGQATSSVALRCADVRYNLYSVYSYIASKKLGDDLRLPANSAIKLNDNCFNHVIQDSGLFTLMFGAGKGTKQTIETLTEWQDKLMQFVLQNNLKATCVEIDCQKVLGVQEAWYFRERMRKLLPNKQINVFHFEDGKKGLDRMIDFSEYMAISVPELRIIKPKTYKSDVCYLARYIKDRKPDIDIHLLGCTEVDLLRKNKFCTSADSTSWLTGVRFGRVNLTDFHVSQFKQEAIDNRLKQCLSLAAKDNVTYSTEKQKKNTAILSLCATICKNEYQKAAGPQN